jgi:hypothetical protein
MIHKYITVEYKKTGFGICAIKNKCFLLLTSELAIVTELAVYL